MGTIPKWWDHFDCVPGLTKYDDTFISFAFSFYSRPLSLFFLPCKMEGSSFCSLSIQKYVLNMCWKVYVHVCICVICNWMLLSFQYIIPIKYKISVIILRRIQHSFHFETVSFHETTQALLTHKNTHTHSHSLSKIHNLIDNYVRFTLDYHSFFWLFSFHLVAHSLALSLSLSFHSGFPLFNINVRLACSLNLVTFSVSLFSDSTYIYTILPKYRNW